MSPPSIAKHLVFDSGFTKGINIAQNGAPPANPSEQGTFACLLWPGPNSWEYGNPEWQRYQTPPGCPGSPPGDVNPFTLKNGHLLITAAPANPQPENGNNANWGQPYTSGMISTHGWFSMLYGYFEIKCKIDAQAGHWPAHWLLPASDVYCAELDNFEFLLRNLTTQLQSTLHGQYGGNWETPYVQPMIADASAAYHTYGVDWGPETTTFYIDGQIVQIPDPNNPGKTMPAALPTPASMNVPMYMIANLAVFTPNCWGPAPSPSNPPTSIYEFDIMHMRAWATANTVNPPPKVPLIADGPEDINATPHTGKVNSTTQVNKADPKASRNPTPRALKRATMQAGA